MSGVEGVVAKAAVGKLMDKVFAPLGKVVEYTLYYRSKVASLQEQSVGLEDKLTDVKGFIEDATRNGNQILQEPTNWVTLTQTALHDARSLKEKSAHDTCCCPFSIGGCNCKRRYDMADEAVELSEDIEKLISTARAFNVTTLSKRARPERLSATYAHPYKALPSMEGYIETLKGALVGSEKCEIVGVYGLKVAGKTLLVRKLAVELDDDSLDEEVNHVVYVSAAMDYYSIQQRIAERVGLILQLKDIQERGMWLTARLTEIGNVVFIIDDVEAIHINLNDFGIPWSHHNKNGCRFVVVSNSLHICRQMSTQMEVEVKHLSTEESLYMFKELVSHTHHAYQTGIDHISYSSKTWLAGEIVDYYNKLNNQASTMRHVQIVATNANEKKTFMLGAEALEIEHVEKPQYWRWLTPSLSTSSTLKVAEVIKIWWLEIGGTVRGEWLSPSTNYKAYFVYNLNSGARGFKANMVEVILGNSSKSCYLDPETDASITSVGNAVLPNTRKDGWLEIEMGNFFNDEYSSAVVKLLVQGTNDNITKTGLRVQGIEIRPLD